MGAGVGKHGLFLEVKLRWDTAMLAHLHAISGCCFETTAGLTICDRRQTWTTKPKILTVWAFKGKVC